MIRATIPNAAGNAMVRGDMQATLDKVMGDVRPQTVYFTVERGQRTIYLIVEVGSAAEFPARLEPLWLGLEADVDVTPVVGAEEFSQAGPGLAAVVPKYA